MIREVDIQLLHDSSFFSDVKLSFEIQNNDLNRPFGVIFHFKRIMKSIWELEIWSNYAQSFYSSIMLHATVKPEDECPIQRLDYDRTNLLKNHPPEAEFVNQNTLQNVISGVKKDSI